MLILREIVKLVEVYLLNSLEVAGKTGDWP